MSQMLEDGGALCSLTANVWPLILGSVTPTMLVTTIAGTAQTAFELGSGRYYLVKHYYQRPTVLSVLFVYSVVLLIAVAVLQGGEPWVITYTSTVNGQSMNYSLGEQLNSKSTRIKCFLPVNATSCDLCTAILPPGVMALTFAIGYEFQNTSCTLNATVTSAYTCTAGQRADQTLVVGPFAVCNYVGQGACDEAVVNNGF